MIKKTITYTDYDGNEVTEDYYFHLNKAEVIEMEASEDGAFSETLKRIAEEKNATLMMKTFKTLILKSVGIKSEDGKHFRKPEGFAEDFESSEAYSALFSELCTNVDEATRFISGILPLDAKQREEIMSKVSSLPAET